MDDKSEDRNMDADGPEMDQEAKMAGGRIGRSVALVVKPGISAKSVHQALEQIFELSGCLACGLLGIDDLNIRVLDARQFQRFKQIDGIQSISVSQKMGG